MSGMKNIVGPDGKLRAYDDGESLVFGGHPTYVEEMEKENRRPKSVVQQEKKDLRWVNGYEPPSDTQIEREIAQMDKEIEKIFTKEEKTDLKATIKEVLLEILQEERANKAENKPKNRGRRRVEPRVLEEKAG